MIVTSKHVVSDNAKYSVVTSANKTYAVKNIYKDPLNDIAILKINPLDNPGNSLKPVPLETPRICKSANLWLRSVPLWVNSKYRYDRSNFRAW